MPFFINDIEAKFIHAEAGEGKAPGISIVAYNGGRLNLGNFSYPVVVDLDGVKAGNHVPFLIDHQSDSDHIMGQGSVQREGNTLLASGTVTGVSDRAKEVLEMSQNGHVFQASIGAMPLKSAFVEEGAEAKINGRTFTGPVVHVVESEIIEVSVVAIGADREGTEVEIAAMFGLDHSGKPRTGNVKAGKEENMNPEFVKWVQAHLGLDKETLEGLKEDSVQKLEAMWKLEKEADDDVPPVDSGIEAQVAGLQEELRISKIEAACGEDFADLSAKAVSEGWSMTQVEASLGEIKKIRDSRPTAPGIVVRGEKGNAEVLEASLALSTTMDRTELEAAYKSETLEGADKMRNLTMKEMIHAACRIDGVQVPALGATPNEWAQAAFSTRTFPTVLSNVANKLLWASYTRRESIATQVSLRLSANDFKTNTRVRAIAGGGMKLIENGGEIKHGTIEDESYTFSIDTYGELLGLTRQDIINDDVSAFTVIPDQMGFDAWQLREELFFTMVLANANNFFHADNDNLSTGAGSVLNLDGLSAAITLLEKQTDGKGRAIALSPEMMLTPPELAATADGFYSSELVVTGEDATRTDRNIYRNRYRPMSSPFLSNSGITGYSATAWYLFTDPRVAAAFGIAYLNGREAPTIEETDPDTRYLGRVFRTYYDLGVCQIDPKGAVKSAGA